MFTDGQFGCFVVGLFNGLMITLWTVGFLIAMMDVQMEGKTWLERFVFESSVPSVCSDVLIRFLDSRSSSQQLLSLRGSPAPPAAMQNFVSAVHIPFTGSSAS